MTATSHAITGAVIALVIKEPVLAYPLALLSHFVCDIIPHVGIKSIDERITNQKKVRAIYIIDLSLLMSFLTALVFAGAPIFVFLCVILAGLPDVVWAYRYAFKEKFGTIKPGKHNFFNHFHSSIQWSETLKYGLPVETLYACILLFIMNQKL